MKKLLLITICHLLIASASFAQLTFSADTSYTTACRGTNVSPTITITNPTNAPITLDWNIDSINSIIPTGYSITGECFLPGLCYPYTNAVHTETIPANSSAIVEPNITIGSNARLDSSCYIKVNVDKKRLVFKVTAIDCVLSTANLAKPNRINLEMYPLPDTNTLNVVHNNNQVSKAVLFNVLGKKIMEYYTPANTNGFSINTADLSDGMYIIDVRDNNNHSLATQRFTKN